MSTTYTVTSKNAWQGYRLSLLAVATMVVIVLAYWATFSRMVDMWSLRTYQHAWLVFPASLYLLWRKREELADQPQSRSWLAVAATALLTLIWIVSRSIGAQVVEFVSVILIICTAFWSVAGTAAMRAAAFPLLLLLIAVPTGEFLTKPLMVVTAEVSSGLLRLTGVPVFRDGQFFTLPGGTFEVADVCSGLRYLLGGVMASLAYAYVTYSRNSKRFVFVATVAVVLVAANGLRAFIVMYVASATDMRIFAGSDHVLFGTVLFALVFSGAVLVGATYADEMPTSIRSSARGAVTDGRSASIIAVAATAMLIASGPLFEVARVKQVAPESVSLSRPLLPDCELYTHRAGDLFPGYPHFDGADLVVRKTFDCNGYSVSAYVAAYRYQAQGKEMISSENRVWPHDVRRFAELTTQNIGTTQGTVDVREVWVRDPVRPFLIWYWYQVGDVVTGSEIRTKFAEARQALSLQPVESSVVAVTIAGAKDEAQEALRRMLEPHAEAAMAWNLDRVIAAP